MESARLIAGLARYAGGDIGLAEELAQDAVVAALEQWPNDGVPAKPGAWLMTVAKRRAVDLFRRNRDLERKYAEIGRDLTADDDGTADFDRAISDDIDDDLLRLIFTACHPVLPVQARVALTLRLLGGLTTAEIARAYLMPEPTIAQRIVRAKKTLASAHVPFETPDGQARPARLASVLEVIYLIFNEGYSATAGEAVIRHQLCAEAIRLARALRELMPDEPEVTGLLALVLLHDARRLARMDPLDHAPVLLDDQDRSRWDRAEIAEGQALLERVLRLHRPGPYQLQAAIAAVHADALRPEDTDWPQIVALYGLLAEAGPSPVVELNRAAAIAMASGPACGLALLDRPEVAGPLEGYRWFHAARADLLRRMARFPEASSAYARALELTENTPERIFLQRRLAEVADR